MKTRKPIARVSKKRAALLKERGEFVREQLAKRPQCEAGFKIQLWYLDHPLESGFHLCSRLATELHEPLTRARAPGRETILSVENSVAICRSCHQWTHAHPKAATEMGLLKPSGFQDA